MKDVRTRIAPSPTGFPHIGTIYQVMFDYAFARRYNGKFILRIEDTDRARFVEGAEDVIYKSLEWFGLLPDESPIHAGEYGPYRQSERLDIYKKYVDELIEKGHAYYCFCTKERLEEMRKMQEKEKKTPMYDKHCRSLPHEEIQKNLQEDIQYVVRMKIPENRKIVVNDLIIGEIEFDSSSVDDQVIQKSDGFPTYHLAVVVDDHLMKISHVFRGKEWISSTPKHVLLYEYFGWEMPFHAHLPLLLNSDGKGKLSKRHGHASVDYYKSEGYLPEAIVNYLSNIVWNHPEGKDIYTFEEFTHLFDINKITSQGARFDLQKLSWMNQQYIQNLSQDELKERLQEFYHDNEQVLTLLQSEKSSTLLELVKTRLNTLKEFYPSVKFLLETPSSESISDESKKIAPKLLDLFSQLDSWDKDSIFSKFKELMSHSEGVKMPIFYNLFTGNSRGLPLPDMLEILGKEETLSRLRQVNE